jgi:lipopolysaccharide/colanic/teichoic acid biosynthesis glycosyltransferase
MYIVDIHFIGPVDSANPTGKLVIFNGFRDGNRSRVTRWTVCNKMRRIADVVIAGAMLAAALPLIFLVALAIRFESPGPILDRISCVGQGGRRFQMLKFRTTVHDPERTRPIWACQPTRIGKFLRDSRIECLPQLINVLRGQISIIDPDRGSPSFLD